MASKKVACHILKHLQKLQTCTLEQLQEIVKFLSQNFPIHEKVKLQKSKKYL